jgi:hypothetical protein
VSTARRFGIQLNRDKGMIEQVEMALVDDGVPDARIVSGRFRYD